MAADRKKAPEEEIGDHLRLVVQRVQTGVRMEKRMIKVLKALAEYLDISLGDLMESIVLHAFEGECPFSEETKHRVQQLKDVYGMDYGVEAAHKFQESEIPG